MSTRGAPTSPKTGLLVLQGTPFCNLDCTYCYLPHRNDRSRMSLETVEAAVAWTYRELEPADSLSVVWHSGEPLVLGAAWYEKAFATAAAAAPPTARLRHHIQTNATLIDDHWCDFFLEHQVVVGVSIDGPADLHDLHRKGRRGEGSHAQVMRGVASLQRRSVPFHVIAVVHAATLDAADRFADFFISEGVTHVGLNIEEIEGVNAASSLSGDDTLQRYALFLDRVLERAEAHGNLHIREADAFVEKLTHPMFGKIRRNHENDPFAIVSVSHDGRVSTFSPELAELSHGVHGPFTFGKVQTTSRAEILADPRFRAISEEITAGVEKCAAECEYFAFCAGGAPSNKLAETGSLASSETLFCRLTQKATVDVLLRRMSAQAASGAPHPQQKPMIAG